MLGSRKALPIVAALGVTLFAILSPHGALGAPARQTDTTATVDPATIDPHLIELPAWAVPAGAAQVDVAELNSDYCVPDVTAPIVDEFLLVHEDWCQGLGASNGIFQDFQIDPTDPTPYVGDWAASVYGSAAAAQAVVQGINSYLASQSEIDGRCNASPNCILSSFQDVETVTNPDGTTSPDSTHNVDYAVWSYGNVVAEVAAAYATTQSDSTAAGYRDFMITNGAILLSEILAGEAPAAPTATPTASPTNTPTIAPTATITPTPPPTAVPTPSPVLAPVNYNVYGADLQSSSRSSAPRSGSGITRLKRGRSVFLGIYLHVLTAPAGGTAWFHWTVLRGNKIVGAQVRGIKLHGNNTRYFMLWQRIFWTKGTYSFRAMVGLDGKHGYRSAKFTVVQ